MGARPVVIFESLDDPGQPYSCEQWGNIGQDGVPIIVDDSENPGLYQLYDWFSINSYFMEMVVLDYNMVFRYYGNSTNSILNLVDEILLESSFAIGDINNDNVIDVLDLIAVVNHIINSGEYHYFSDINQDMVIDILDVIILINIILET